MHTTGMGVQRRWSRKWGWCTLVPLGSAANKILTFELQQPERLAGYWVKMVRRWIPMKTRKHIMLACVKEPPYENLRAEITPPSQSCNGANIPTDGGSSRERLWLRQSYPGVTIVGFCAQRAQGQTESQAGERYRRAEASQCSWIDLNILIPIKEREVISALAAIFLEEGQNVLVYTSEQQTSCW